MWSSKFSSKTCSRQVAETLAADYSKYATETVGAFEITFAPILQALLNYFCAYFMRNIRHISIT